MTKDRPDNAVHPLTRADWRTWLADNHQRDEGVWFVRVKKSSGKPSFDLNEAVGVAPCVTGSTYIKTRRRLEI